MKLKKFKYIAYLFFIVITTVLIILIYDTISKGESGKTSKEKALSEVEFLEGKIETLLNKMYNIETRNYNVSVIEITKQSEETKNKTTSTEGKEESGSSSSSGESSNSNLGSNSNEEPSAGSSGNQGVGQQGEKNKKYEMEEAGVLLDSGNINWSKVKSEIETLYSAIPTITLDLYQVNVSQDDILGFNKEFDKLTTAVKDENTYRPDDIALDIKTTRDTTIANVDCGDFTLRLNAQGGYKRLGKSAGKLPDIIPHDRLCESSGQVRFLHR